MNGVFVVTMNELKKSMHWGQCFNSIPVNKARAKPFHKRGRGRVRPLAQKHIADNDDDVVVQKKKLTISSGWMAPVEMMSSVGCTCTSLPCRCDSHPWGENPHVFAEKISSFLRTPVPRISSGDDIEFYLMCMSYTRCKDATAIEIHGMTPDKHTIYVRVRGFDPYFFMELSRRLTPHEEAQFTSLLRSVLDRNKPYSMCPNDKTRISLATGLISAHHYNASAINALYKITAQSPRMVSCLRKFLHGEEGKKFSRSNDDSDSTTWNEKKNALLKNPFARTPFENENISIVRLYEANVDFTLRFCLDLDIRGCAYLSIPRDHFNKCYGDGKKSHAQIEGWCSYQDLHVVSSTNPNAVKPPPSLILSYDIEAVNVGGHFPHAENAGDWVSSVCAVLYDTESHIRKKIGFTLGTCNESEGITTIQFCTEKGLLLAWSKFIRDIQPDILTGYNIDRFDNKYMMDRATKLGIVDEYARYSRGKNNYSRASVRESVFNSKGSGKIERYSHYCPGVVTMDLIGIVRRDFCVRLGSYTLGNVAKHVVGEQKDDVHYSEIPILFGKDAGGRTILLRYCVQDAALPIDIICKRQYYMAYIMLSRITRTFLNYLIEKGQTAKVKSQVLAQAKLMNMVVPTLMDHEKSRRKYEGAYVEHPLPGYYGFHEDMTTTYKTAVQGVLIKRSVMQDRSALLDGRDNPMTVLDFSSLYPSIIIGCNLCYTTKTCLDEIERNGWILSEDYIRTPAGFYFVTRKIREGLLPIVCKNLLAARNVEKRLMKAAAKQEDKLNQSIHNSNQLGIKTSANSVYGFCGAWWYPDRDISESICLFGQKFIISVRESIIKKVRPGNKWKRVVRMIPGSWVDTALKLERMGVPIKHYPHMKECYEVNRENGIGTYQRSFFYDTKRCWSIEFDNSMRNGIESSMKMSVINRGEGVFIVTRDNPAHWDDRLPWEYSDLENDQDWMQENISDIPEERSPHQIAYWVNFPRQAVAVYGDTDSVMMVISGGTIDRHYHEICRRLRLKWAGRKDQLTNEKIRHFSRTDLRIKKQVREVYLRILVEESFDIGEIAAAFATEEIGIEAIKLMLEELYLPFRSQGKKKYDGMCYMYPTQKIPTYTAKGIETKRRDNFLFLRETIEMVNNILTEKIERPVGESIFDHAIHRTIVEIRRLISGRVSAFKLIRSATLKRRVDEYKSDPPQRNLTMRDMKTNPGTEANTQDRVHWIIIKETYKKQKIAERAHHPEVVVRDRLSIDYAYYTTCLLKAIYRVFAPLIGKEMYDHIDLLRWDKAIIEKETKRVTALNIKMTRDMFLSNNLLSIKNLKRSVSAKGKVSVGGMTDFATHIPRCLYCHCTIRPDEFGVTGCRKMRKMSGGSVKFSGVYFHEEDCIDQRQEMLSASVRNYTSLEMRRYCCDVKCLNCQTDMYNVVPCSNRECQTFYDKLEVSIDIEDLELMMKRMVPTEEKTISPFHAHVTKCLINF